MQKVRVGVIGCGGIGRSKHLEVLSKLQDKVEIVALCDREIARAQAAALEFGSPQARCYSDFRKMFAAGEMDAVHICTPNATHCEIAVAALESGIHVMCEKPIALNGKQAKVMCETARRTGKKLTIGYQNRFRDDVLYLKEICRAGTLGEIYYAKAHATRRKGVPTWGVFLNKELQGGGPVMDIATHALDMTLWLMDNYAVDSVMGKVFYKMKDNPEGNVFGRWDPDRFTVEDSAFAMITMKNKAVIYLETSWALNISDPLEAAATLCGTDAGAELRQKKDGSYFCRVNRAEHGKLVSYQVDDPPTIAFESVADDRETGFREISSWIDTIMEDKEPVVLPAQAAVVAQILDAIYESDQAGRPVYF